MVVWRSGAAIIRLGVKVATVELHIRLVKKRAIQIRLVIQGQINSSSRMLTARPVFVPFIVLAVGG